MPIPAAPADFVVAHVGIDNPANKPAVRFTFTNNEAGATHLIQTSANGTTGWKDLVEAASGKAFVDAHGFALSAKSHFRIRAEFAAQGTFSDWVYVAGNPLITLPKLPTATVQINAPSNLVVAQNDFRAVKLTWTRHSLSAGPRMLCESATRCCSPASSVSSSPAPRICRRERTGSPTRRGWPRSTACGVFATARRSAM